MRASAHPYPDERSFYIHPCFRQALGAARATSVHESETWQISLWGPTASGKTTFLAALNIAAAESHARPLIYGINDESTDFLKRNTHLLKANHRFPPPTVGSQPLSFAINVPALSARNYDTATPAVPTQFNIDIRDDPGRCFNPESMFYRRVRLEGLWGEDEDEDEEEEEEEEEDFIEGLSRSDGFIFLIDPLLGKGDQDLYDAFGDLLLKVAQRCNEQERIGDGWLPHYLAACIAKFDHPDIYQWAQSSLSCRIRADDPCQFPHVPDDMAKDFFCGIHPIGVIEPILWLGHCLTTIGD